MIFFTDISTKASSYCMLNINRYNSKLKKNKKLVFVDPGVWELTKGVTEYEFVEKLHRLAQGNLEDNEYISIDYPCDMNEKYTDFFIEKSITNNLVYQRNPKYICTIQSKFRDFKDFKKRFDDLGPIFLDQDKILGIGNMCRIMQPNTFTDNVFRYILRFRNSIRWVHFYGLAHKLIMKYIPMLEGWGMKTSVDHTKWTRACHNKLKRQYGLNCSSSNRDEFFLENIKKMKKKIKVIM